MLARLSSSNPAPSATAATVVSPIIGNRVGGNDREQLICALVRRYLVLAQVSPSEWTKHEAALMLLSESLLGCSLTPASNIATEEAVSDAITKRIATRSGADGLEKGIRFNKTIAELQKHYPSRKLWSMLYFLLRIAEKNGNNKGGGGGGTMKMADILSVPIHNNVRTVISGDYPNDLTRLKEDYKPLAEYWKQYLELRQKTSVISEQAILRDLIFVLQGTDGNILRYEERYGGVFKVIPAAQLNNSIKQLAEKAAECGGLCNRIKREIFSGQELGPTRQSLNRAIDRELCTFMRTVACYEATLAAADQSMTLRMAAVWFAECQPSLSFMVELLNNVRGMSGAGIINAVEEFCSHGDDKIATIAKRILIEVLFPTINKLVEFVQNGSLIDPFQELFIKQRASGGGGEQEQVFESETFTIDETKIPFAITRPLAQKILLTGKTKAFLEAITNEMDMGMDIDQSEAIGGSSIDNLNSLIELVNQEHQTSCRQLAFLLKDRYFIKKHFQAICDFIHFGRGDFASSLVDSLSLQLFKPASALFRHALVSCLDQVLLSLPDGGKNELRERMDVRLHESSNPKLTGWDVFTLDYKVDFPLNVILTNVAMEQHVKISHFLWSLRRVSFVLNNCWSRTLTICKMAPPDLMMDLKRLQMMLQEGSAIARQINLFTERTVHACWKRFFTSLDKEEAPESGLEYYIEIHEVLLGELKNNLIIYSNQASKGRLAGVLSALLRVEGSVKGYERYISLYQEHDRRVSARHRSSWSTSLPEDEALIETFPASSMRLLAEQRAAFQNTARSFQTELDELMLQLQKEASTMQSRSVTDLLMILDFGGYHKRRNGFDQRKYTSILK